MAHPQWTQRQVDAPADDLLTFETVAKLLGVSTATLKRLIADGEFPDALQVSPGTRVWEWRAVAYYRLRVEMRPRLAGPKADNQPEG